MTNRPRPTKLSDPHHEIGPDLRAILLSRRDHQFLWSDFTMLLGPHLPAGTYEEVVYFLPLAFDFVQSGHEDAIQVTYSLVGFVSLFASNLEADSALGAARRRLKDLLLHWSKDFIVLHDPQGRRGDWVQNSYILHDTLERLIEFQQHKDIAVEFIDNLSHHNGNPIRAAWFLAFARHQLDYSYPIEDERLIALATDADLLSHSAKAVATDPQLLTASPTYWRDLFHLFDLTPESA